jgi:hypothetical protein
MLALLVTSQCTPAIAETAQQDQVLTATASASKVGGLHLIYRKGIQSLHATGLV